MLLTKIWPKLVADNTDFPSDFNRFSPSCSPSWSLLSSNLRRSPILSRHNKHTYYFSFYVIWIFTSIHVCCYILSPNLKRNNLVMAGWNWAYKEANVKEKLLILLTPGPYCSLVLLYKCGNSWVYWIFFSPKVYWIGKSRKFKNSVWENV